MLQKFFDRRKLLFFPGQGSFFFRGAFDFFLFPGSESAKWIRIVFLARYEGQN